MLCEVEYAMNLKILMYNSTALTNKCLMTVWRDMLYLGFRFWEQCQGVPASASAEAATSHSSIASTSRGPAAATARRTACRIALVTCARPHLSNNMA